MFVIGRNVEVKVEGENLIITCKIVGVEAGMWMHPKRRIIATTHGKVDIPTTNVSLTLEIVGPILQ